MARTSRFRRFGMRVPAIVFLSTATALGIRLLIDPWLQDQTPYTTFIVAVAITGLYAGVRASAIAAVLGGVLGNLFFVEPRLELVAFATRQDRASFISYLVASALIMVLTNARNTAFSRANSLLQKLKAIVNASPLAILSLGVDRTAHAWNPAAERMMGWSAAEAVGAILPLPSTATNQWADLTRRILQGETLVNIESRLLTKGGEEIDALISGSPVRNLSGMIEEFVVIVADATEANRARHVLIESEKLAAAGRLASTIAHEVNNPLEGAINLVFLARGEDNREQARKYLQSAEHELSRASAMARKTLTFLAESLSPEQVQVEEIVNQVLALFERRCADRGISLKRKFHDRCELIAYSHELRVIITNLIANATDAMAHGGTLAVSVRPASHPTSGRRGVRITIADTGIGIPADYCHKIFEPFFTTKPATGTGLGLWATKSMVERSGGGIRMHSSTAPEHHGTVFTVFLPSTVVAPSMGLQSFAAEANAAGRLSGSSSGGKQ